MHERLLASLVREMQLVHDYARKYTRAGDGDVVVQSSRLSWGYSEISQLKLRIWRSGAGWSVSRSRCCSGLMRDYPPIRRGANK